MLRAGLRSARTTSLDRSHVIDGFFRTRAGQARNATTTTSEYAASQLQPKKQAAFLAGFFNGAHTPRTNRTSVEEYSASCCTNGKQSIPSTSKLQPPEKPDSQPKLHAQDRALLRALWRLQRFVAATEASKKGTPRTLEVLQSKMQRIEQLLQEGRTPSGTTSLRKRAIRTLESLSRLFSHLVEEGMLGTDVAGQAARLLVQLSVRSKKPQEQVSRDVQSMVHLAKACISLREPTQRDGITDFVAYLSMRPSRSQQSAFLEHIVATSGIRAAFPFMEQTGFAFLSSASSGILDILTKEALKDPKLLESVGSSIYRARKPCADTPIKSRKLWALHAALFRQSPGGGNLASQASRMYGPSESQMDLFLALKHLLSAWIVRATGQATGGTSVQERKLGLDRKIRDTFSALLAVYRQHRLPPDRQVMAAVLHAADACTPEQRKDLRGHLDWIWQEWTIRRENDARKEEDECLLIAFLDAASGEGDSAWHMQALDMALSEAGVRPSPLWRMQTSPQPDDRPINIHPELARAIALAALRLGRVETTLDCLFECQMLSRHALKVLYELSIYHHSLEKAQAARLAYIMAGFIRQHWQKDPPNLSSHHPHRLMPVILVLFHHQHFREGLALLQTLHTPIQLGTSNLAAIFRNLVYHRRSTSALSVFRSIPVQQLKEHHWIPLLRSMDARLSDNVWQDLIQSGQIISTSTLNARLTHYIKDDGRRYLQALSEYRQHQQVGEPDVRTRTLLLDLHVKAGRSGIAFKAYKHLQRRPDAPSDLINHILPVLSQPAKPYYRKVGPASTLRKASKGLDRLLVADGQIPDGVTANIVLGSSLRWGELDNEAVWAALRAGLVNSAQRSWHREIRPLFRMVIRAFLSRGNKDEARKAVVVMAKEKIARSTR